MIWEYVTTYADFKAAYFTHLRTTWFGRVRLWIYRTMPIVELFGIFELFEVLFRHHHSFFGLPTWDLCLFAALFAWGDVRRRANLRRRYKKMKSGRAEGAPLILELSGNTLIWRVPGKKGTSYPAGSIVELVEGKKVNLIYIGKKKYLPIPKDAIPENDMHVLRGWINSSKLESRAC